MYNHTVVFVNRRRNNVRIQSYVEITAYNVVHIVNNSFMIVRKLVPHRLIFCIFVIDMCYFSLLNVTRKNLFLIRG